MPPIRPSTTAANRSSSNGTPSPRMQGQQSSQSPIPLSTPSTANSSMHTTAQSNVDPNVVANTREETTLEGMYLNFLISLYTNSGSIST